jgi:autotransporter-associated beta strand protein
MSNAGNVYTGLTRIYGGTLRYGAANAVNTGGVTLAGGTLDFNGQTDSVGAIILYSGTITDSNVTPGALTGSSYTFYGGAISGVLAGTGVAMPKNSGSTLTINKSLTNTGTLTANAGTVQYLASNVLSNTSPLTVAGGTIDIGANSDTVAAVTLTSGSIIGSTGVLTGASYAVATGKISAILAGAVNLTKTSTGTVVLDGTNTYTGITTIQGGALSVGTIGDGGVPGNLGAATNAAANIVFSTGTGTLIYTGGTASTDRNITTTTAITMQIDVNDPSTTLTMSGATTNTTAPFTKVGGGTLVLSGTNLHTGVTTVLAGTLKYGAANVLSTGAVTVTNGILDMNGQTDSVGTVTLTNGGNIIDSAGSAGVLTSTATYALQSGFVSAKLGSAVAAGISKTTTDRVVLTADNPYTSTSIALSAGKLRIGHNNALGASGTTLATTVTSGAVLETYNGITVPSTKTLTLNGTGIVAQGAVLNVSGTNTLAGAVTLGATGVRINSAGGTLTCSGTMTGTGFAVTFGGAGNIVYSGAVNTSTAATVTKDGTGTTTLSNANNYTGVTTISAGVLAISNATSTGTTAGGVTVASGAALEISGTTTVGAEALSLNGTGISSGGALRSTSGATAWQGAVTLASNSSIGVDANTLTISGAITGSGSIGLTKVGAATLSISTTTLGGSMTISAGTLSAAVNISVGADWSNSGTFTANSSTVSLTSSTAAAITGTTTFNHLSVTGIGAAKTISFEHGSTTTVSGTWTVTGASGQLITLTRDSTSNWSVNPSAVSIDYVDVSYSTNLGSTICATHSVSTNGGNSGWNVTAGAACAATISISGTVYQSGAEGSVFDCTTNIVLYVSVNGGSNTAGSCTAVNGTFTISGVPDPAAANVPVVIFSDSSAAQKTTTVTLSSAAATNITGISLFIGRVTVTSESATNMTNTFMQTADNADPGIRYSVVTSGTNNLTTESGMELHVLAGKTFVPGGTVTTTAASTSGNPDGDVHIPGTATLSMGTNALSVGGDFTNAGTFSKSSSQTTTFTATGTGFTITPNGNNFENLTFNGVGGGWTMSAVTAVDGNLTITNGTLTAPSAANLTVSGNYSNSGSFTHNSGTVIFNAGASGKTIAGTMTGGSSFNNVQFNNASGGWTTNNSLTAAGTFVVTAGAVTHGANTTLTVNGTNFTLSSGITWTKTSGTGKIVLDHATNLAFADNTSPKQKPKTQHTHTYTRRANAKRTTRHKTRAHVVTPAAAARPRAVLDAHPVRA